MLLLIIFSVYATLLIALAIAVAVTRRIPGWAPVTRYLIAGALGSLLGFIVANGCVVLAGAAPIMLADQFTLPQWLNYTGAVMVAGLLLIGPIFASIIGVVAGFAGGLYFVFKRQRNTLAPPPPRAGQIDG